MIESQSSYTIFTYFPIDRDPTPPAHTDQPPPALWLLVKDLVSSPACATGKLDRGNSMLKISPGINFSLASLLSFIVVIGKFVFRCNRWNLRRCCYLLFLVGWLVAFFLEYFVRLKVDSVSHTRIGQRGLSWRRVLNRRSITGKTGGKLAEGKFCSSTLALLLILGRFLCCVEGLFCKTRAGSR